MSGARVLAISLASLAAVAAIGSHAASRQRARDADARLVADVVRRMPSADFSIAGGARHLRAPSREEPWAAFTDGPATPDVDPAGMAIAPPVELWLGTARSTPRGAP